MAFDKTGLQPIGGQAKAGNAPQMWSYTSTDRLTVIDGEGYFNDVSDLLKVGDLIYVHASIHLRELTRYTQWSTTQVVLLIFLMVQQYQY